jgi:hypothetical protein
MLFFANLFNPGKNPGKNPENPENHQNQSNPGQENLLA